MQAGVQGQPAAAEALDALEGLPVPLDQILGEVFSLYRARSPEELCALLKRRYREDAAYTDPTLVARPRSEVALAFFALQHLFCRVEVGGIRTQAMELAPQGRAPPMLQVDVASRQCFHFARTQPITQQILPAMTTHETTSRLHIDPRTGLVVRHEDAWLDRPSLHLPYAWRRLNCICSHAVYRLVGWGRVLAEAEARGRRWDDS